MKCDPNDIALKSFFLGPQAENGPWLKEVVCRLFDYWFAWRRSRYPLDGKAISKSDMELPEFTGRREDFLARLNELMNRFEKEVPKFSPRYVGHMFSEISLPALLGHMVAVLHNPNNVSGESSRVGVEIENEAVRALQRMLGNSGAEPLGHFTSGGSIANFEALLRARTRLAYWISLGAQARKKGLSKLGYFESAHLGWEGAGDWRLLTKSAEKWNLYQSDPFEVMSRLRRVFHDDLAGPIALIPENKHYSWKKGVSMIGIGSRSIWPIELDSNGRLSVAHLKNQIERARKESRPIVAIVSVAGSTELGTIDPIHEIQRVVQKWKARGIHLWHHVDAAFGGLFCSIRNEGSPLSRESTRALGAIGLANSVTLDPHKLGYVPYSCGTFLCRDPQDYSVVAFGAPYVQSSASDHGPYTLEGSRAATGAAATWMTAHSIGLDPEGYGRILERTIEIRKRLGEALERAHSDLRVLPGADTNILGFVFARNGDRISRINRVTEKIYEAFSPAGQGPFFVSKTRLSLKSYRSYLESFLSGFNAVSDAPDLAVIRICVMNPFFNSIEMNTDFEKSFVAAIVSVLGESKEVVRRMLALERRSASLNKP